MAYKMLTKWMNVYRAGYYHAVGKPSTIDRHGGDLYDSPTQAMAHIGEPTAYVATVPVTYPEPDEVRANPADSVPIPVHIARRMLFNKTDETNHDRREARD